MVRSDYISISFIERMPCCDGIFSAAEKTKMNTFASFAGKGVPLVFLGTEPHTGETASIVLRYRPIPSVYVFGYASKVFNSVVSFVPVYMVNKLRLRAVMNDPSASVRKVNPTKDFGVKISSGILRCERLLAAKLASPFCMRLFSFLCTSRENAFRPWLEGENSSRWVIIQQNPKQFGIIKSVRHVFSSLAYIRNTLTITGKFVGVKANA